VITDASENSITWFSKAQFLSPDNFEALFAGDAAISSSLSKRRPRTCEGPEREIKSLRPTRAYTRP